MSNFNFSKEQIDYLLSPAAIRERTEKIFSLSKTGKTHFELHLDKLNEVVDFVIDVINDNYPDHNIPFHSRWGHFQVGGKDRISLLDNKLFELDAKERARAKIDLVITSVLLDAGAGMQWKYIEGEQEFSKSEGLAVASFNMFMEGDFSSHGKLEASVEGLKSIQNASIEEAFQVSPSNPLVGIEGRVQLLNNLGKTVAAKKQIFKDGRPGNLIDYLMDKHGSQFEVQDILNAVLEGLSDIWPGRLSSGKLNLGDMWLYQSFGNQDDFKNLVPFHKLSQWLTYSLVAPIEEAGVEVAGAHKLTGLAEYRNGGLFIDKGLITLRDKSLYEKKHKPESELIIEWRALTVCLLDLVGDMVCKKLNKTKEEFPLAKVLEGGTWHAGRRAAKELRADGGPPLQLDSDGTVF